MKTEMLVESISNAWYCDFENRKTHQILHIYFHYFIVNSHIDSTDNNRTAVQMNDL